MDEFLQDLDKIFQEVKDQEEVYQNLPDGEYLAEIEEVKHGDSKKGIPMVTIIFNITHGEYEGKQHRKFLMLAGKDKDQTTQNVHRYATEIKKLGLNTSKGLESTFAQFPTLSGKSVKLTLKTTISKSNGSAFLNTSIEVL